MTIGESGVLLDFGDLAGDMGVDRVQSEPLSVQFPLTGNNTEKF
jgi:hypothetical protein